MTAEMTRFQKLVNASNNSVFFGGAGVSTESGIPDFRGENGIYNIQKTYGDPAEKILSRPFFDEQPERFFEFYRQEMVYLDAKPNTAHFALARLELMGKLKAVITQNIDGLHQMAGSSKVLELHGSIHRNYCMNCGKFFDLDYMMKAETVPRCNLCGNKIKPDVVLYQEGLDDDVFRKSAKAISEAEVLIIGGTSLNVYPAAGLIRYFKGRALVLINKSETPYDSQADLVIHDSIGKVLGEVTKNI